MRRPAAIMLVAMSAASALAFTAGDGEAVVCAESAYAPVLTTEGLATMITAPNSITAAASTDLYFTVDLGPDAYADTLGSVTADLSWNVVTNDYDLGLNGQESAAFQPIAAPTETLSSAVKHCAIISVQAIDFLAPATVEDLSLELTVSRTN